MQRWGYDAIFLAPCLRCGQSGALQGLSSCGALSECRSRIVCGGRVSARDCLIQTLPGL